MDLSDLCLTDFAGKNVVLNIFPSISGPDSAASVKKFNALAPTFENTVVLCISLDLPFTHERFYHAENLANIIPLSEFRHTSFGDVYGLRISEGPLKGLLSRAVIILDSAGKVTYTEQVTDLDNEPDYDAAVNALKTSQTDNLRHLLPQD